MDCPHSLYRMVLWYISLCSLQEERVEMHNSQWCTPWDLSWLMTSQGQHPNVAQGVTVKVSPGLLPIKTISLVQLFREMLQGAPSLGRLFASLQGSQNLECCACRFNCRRTRRESWQGGLPSWTPGGSLVETKKEVTLCLEKLCGELLREGNAREDDCCLVRSAFRVLGGEAGHWDQPLSPLSQPDSCPTGAFPTCYHLPLQVPPLLGHTSILLQTLAWSVSCFPFEQLGWLSKPRACSFSVGPRVLSSAPTSSGRPPEGLRLWGHNPSFLFLGERSPVSLSLLICKMDTNIYQIKRDVWCPWT